MTQAIAQPNEISGRLLNVGKCQEVPMKRKTLLERADEYAKWNCQYVLKEHYDRDFATSSGSWLAGYRAGKREGKKEAMKACGWSND